MFVFKSAALVRRFCCLAMVGFQLRMIARLVVGSAEANIITMSEIVEPKDPVSQSAAGSSTVSTPSNSSKRSSRRWRWLAVPIALLVLFYAVVGYFGSGLLIGDHPRWRGMNRGPKDLGIQGEVVSFQATDGVPLKAWWLPAEGAPRATVILAHGVDHTRQVMLGRAAFLVHGGYNALALDLRGHGESGGRFVSPGLVETRDLLGAIQYVRSRGERGPIVLMGVSLGAEASLLPAAQSREVAAVVSDGAFTSGAAVFLNGTSGPLLPFRDWFVRSCWPTTFEPESTSDRILSRFCRLQGESPVPCCSFRASATGLFQRRMRAPFWLHYREAGIDWSLSPMPDTTRPSAKPQLCTKSRW